MSYKDKFSILHISDLHREKSSFDNRRLVYALKKDLENLRNDGIEWPQICVVSGDLVQGAPKEAANPREIIDGQYEETGDLLSILASDILNGLKSNIVIIPGNHDVCRAISANSFNELELPPSGSERSKLFESSQNPSQLIRFCPESHSYFAVINREEYWKRFEPFTKFYNHFYNSEKKYSLIPHEQFDILEFWELRLVIVTFNSCAGVDNFNFRPHIHPDAIVEACQLLDKDKYRNCLIIAVWHHNLRSSISGQDSLDCEFIKHLMLANVSFGLHGHQHSAEVQMFDRVFRNQQQFPVISVGSFCSSPKQLPYAVPRGYNLITIDTNIGLGKAYFRQMDSSNDYPAFSEYIPPNEDRHYKKFIIPKIDSEKVKLSQVSLLENNIMNMLLRNKAMDALNLITNEANKNLRPFLVEALKILDDPELILKWIEHPLSISEAYLLARAILETGNRERAKSFITDKYVSENLQIISPLLPNLRGLADAIY